MYAGHMAPVHWLVGKLFIIYKLLSRVMVKHEGIWFGFMSRF